jgi:hypothetical protein
MMVKLIKNTVIPVNIMKPGDKVRIKTYDKIDMCEKILFTEQMEKLCGEIVILSRQTLDPKIWIIKDNTWSENMWLWHEDWFAIPDFTTKGFILDGDFDI